MEKALIFLSLILNLALLYKLIPKAMSFFQQKIKSFGKELLIKLGLYSNRSHTIAHKFLVYRTYETKVYPLQGDRLQEGLQQLPDQLILEPGKYFFNDQCYDLSSEGLYRFICPHKKLNLQRIVYKDDSSALMSSLAWIMTHGHKNDNAAYNVLIQTAKNDKLILTCESMVRFAFTFLSKLNVKSRIIGARTLEQWNGYDDGHYLIEVFRPELNKWVLYDLDTDACFTYNNQLLSLIEFMEHVGRAEYEIKYISNDVRAALDDVGNSQHNFSFINEGRIADLKSWYKRIMQLVFIDHENVYISSSIQPNIEKYPKGAFPKINYVTRKELISSFYQ
jgi:hypothetical protein